MSVQHCQRWIVFLLPLVVIFMACTIVLAVEEIENNDTFLNANEYVVGEEIQGMISTDCDQDIFRFYAVKNAEVKITLEGIPLKCDFDLALYDYQQFFMFLSSNPKHYSEQLEFIAPYSGYYYIQVMSWQGSAFTPYTIQISMYSDGDDSFDQAQSIVIPEDNASVTLQNTIQAESDIDWYVGVIEIPQKIRVQLQVPSWNDFDIYVYDKELHEIGRGVMETGVAEEIEVYITPTNAGKIYFQIVNSEKAVYYDRPYILSIYTIPDKPIKVVREAYQYVICTIPWQGRFPYDSPPGVAYSWGTKDTLEYFSKKLMENETEGVNSAKWVDQFIFKGGNYNGKPDAPNIERVIKWGVGLKGDTIWAGGPSYNDPHKWAGIDCSGLVQRCQYVAGYNISNIGTGKFNQFGGEVPASWWASHCTKIGDSKTGINGIQIGDVATVTNSKGRITHVMLVSYVPYGVTPNKDNVKVIHAFSSPYLSGRKVQETLLNRVSNYTIWRMRE